MKKVLALILMASVVQGSSLNWEYDVIKQKQSYASAVSGKYENFSDVRLRSSCQVTPKGWIGEYTVEAACNILNKKFAMIDEYAKKAIENNQSPTFSELEKDSKFITREDARDLIQIIFNGSVVYLNGGNRYDAEISLYDDYKEHFNTAVTNELRSKQLFDLSKKYSN